MAKPPYGILLGPFLAGAVVTLLVAAGTRQPITAAWIMAAVMVGATLAALAFAGTLWRHEPHVVAGVRARQRGATGSTPSGESGGDSAVGDLAALSAEALAAPGPGAGPRRDDRRHADPLAHIHAVEDQGRKLRRNCVNCGTPVSVSAAACSNCGQPQTYQCKGCQTPIRLEWAQCPECGREVH